MDPQIVPQPSITGLIKELLTDVQTLIREEIALRSGGPIDDDDDLDWPVWAGFLVVAVLLSIIGFITLSAGRKKLQTVHAVPEETVTTIKENSEWIAKRLSSVRR